MTDFEIRTSLQDHRPDDALEDGYPYCSVVMAYNRPKPGTNIGGYGGWYNTGIVVWAATPEDSFLQALDEHRKRFPK